MICGGIADDLIGPSSPDRMFDDRAKGDAQIARKPADRRMAARDQADRLRRRIARQIERVGPAAIPDRHHRIKVEVKVIDRPRRCAEAIGVVSRARRTVGTIDQLQRLNVMDPQRIRPQRSCACLLGAEGAHHGELLAVLHEIGVGCVADRPRRRVEARRGQPKAFTDQLHHHQRVDAAGRGQLAWRGIGVSVDEHIARHLAEPRITRRPGPTDGPVPRAEIAVKKRRLIGVAAGVLFDKGQSRNLGEHGQKAARQLHLGWGELRKAGQPVIDRFGKPIAQRDGGAALGSPTCVAVDDPRDHRGVELRLGANCRGHRIVARDCPDRAGLKIVTTAVQRREPQDRVAIGEAVVIFS